MFQFRKLNRKIILKKATEGLVQLSIREKGADKSN